MKRTCPLCERELANLHQHLKLKHKMCTREQRTPYLRKRGKGSVKMEGTGGILNKQIQLENKEGAGKLQVGNKKTKEVKDPDNVEGGGSGDSLNKPVQLENKEDAGKLQEGKGVHEKRREVYMRLGTGRYLLIRVR